jgi:tetratricopeptide (TPR) repeat protein
LCTITLLVISILNVIPFYAQQSKIGSLKRIIDTTTADTLKILLLEELGQSYRDEKKIDSAVFAYKQALEINENGNYWPQKQCWDVASIDYLSYEMGNYLESLKYASRHLALSKQLNDTIQIGLSYLVFGHNYRELGEYRQSLNNYFKGKEFIKLFWTSRKEPEDNTYTILCIANTYLKMNNLDSALVYARLGYDRSIVDSVGVYTLLATRIFGDIYFARQDEETALRYYRQYIPDFIKYKETNRDLSFALNGMAKIFQRRGEMDSSVFYAKKAFTNAQQYSDQENLFTAGMLLSDYYITKDEGAAFKYLKIATQAKDSMASIEKLKQAQILSYTEQVREKEKAAADAREATKTRLIIIIASVFIFFTSLLIWYRIRQLRLRHKMILEQKESERLKVEYEKELLDMEAKVLRAQMNPHFIFNCLTSINRYIVKSDNKTASNYLTKFSKLIRLILDNSAADYISLDVEIQTLQLYISMEALRFDHVFDYEIEADESLISENTFIPPMLVQPYAENAIWHGLLHKEEKGKLYIRFMKEKEDLLRVEIEDNGVGRQKAKEIESNDMLKKKSYGMQISKSRIELINKLSIYNTSVNVQDLRDEEGNASGTKITLTIPINKIPSMENINKL